MKTFYLTYGGGCRRAVVDLKTLRIGEFPYAASKTKRSRQPGPHPHESLTKFVVQRRSGK